MSSPQNWLILLSYNGTNFHGWQVQPNTVTIEGSLENSILQLTGKTVRVHGAGRTDAGVHALNFTANFHISSSNFDQPEKWCRALNAVLPSDIVVKDIQKIPQNFHARHNSVAKRYRYSICNLPFQPPFSIKKSWWIRHPLNVVDMREASAILVGENDFSAFRASHCSSLKPVKTLSEISIFEKRTSSATLNIEFQANSFLQHMVRIISGTLIEVGLGRKTVKDVETALKSKDRGLSGKTAPSHGLYALKVMYPNDSVKWRTEVLDE